MDLGMIRKTVGQLVPNAKDIRTRDMGGEVHALLAEIDGKARSVMFTSFGLYGEGIQALLSQWPKSDLSIAVQLSKALESK